MRDKLIAEVFGTFLLVFFGCGTAVLMGGQVGMLGIAFAFGLAMVLAAYLLGGVSGAHINPAVSLAMHLCGRMERSEMWRYWIAQVLGALLAVLLILLVASGSSGFSVADQGLGQNGYGSGYLGEYNALSALIFEVFATFIFVLVVLRTTEEKGGAGQLAGLLIGLTLLLIHIVGINVTGVSVNPARSIGPALFAGWGAIADLWVFILGPLAGAWLASIVHDGTVQSYVEKAFGKTEE